MSDKSSGGKSLPIIGISIGDINGIGPEVIIKALDDTRITKLLTPVIYASGGLISYYRKQLERHHFNYNQIKEAGGIIQKKVNVVNAWQENIDVEPGKQNEIGGKHARKSLESAVDDLKKGKLDALVTAPFNKELVQADGFKFPGHTEYLMEVFEVKNNLMLMVSEELRVGVVTGHIPLKEVSEALSAELVRSKIKILISALQKDFGIKKPKIAVLGLNPHAGENGVLGSEESEIITPVIDSFREKGQLVMGPFPADGFFGAGQYVQFDAVLAMYHDQGLIPFKYISGGLGVNYTAGIPAVRTSPAHGTAYDLAGKNLADPGSMRNAIFLALDLARNKAMGNSQS